jgi:flagellar hook-associated protein 1 FlgK
MSFFPQGSYFGIGLIGTTLNAYQLAENVTADNISNVNTPGASRQQVQFSQAAPVVGSAGYAAHVGGTVGDGVVVSNIQRINSESYNAMFRGASSSENYYSVQNDSLTSLQSNFGDPTSGVSTEFSAFQTAVNQMVAQAGSGQSTPVRANVLSQAQALTTALNQDASAVTAAKATTLTQAGTIVTTVNGILDQIASLNSQIRASTAVGDSPNTFADQRDNLIDQLSQYISTQTAVQPDGSTLVSVNGQALVNDAVAYHLAAPTIGTSATGQPTFKIDFATTPPASSTSPGIPLGSGQLAGLQDLYNNKLTSYGTQLDQFASGLADSVNRVTQAAYDQNGQAGQALFGPIVGNLPISAANIQVSITNPSQLPLALASTASGSLVVPLNSANNTVDTSQQLTNNGNLANPPAGPLGGTLTVNVDGVAQIYTYSTAAGGNADSIDDFIGSFNAQHMGVTASYDASSQRMVFARDPANTDLAQQAAQGANPTDPTFSIADSNYVPATPATSLLGTLGAGGIDSVVQNGSNAFGAGDNGAANALLSTFSSAAGVPALQTTSAAAAVAGTQMTVALPAGVTDISVGAVLTLDAQTGGGLPQENVVVSAVSVNPATGIESVTFTPAQAHAANFSIASAQVQTLGAFYGNLVTQLGLDAQTATTGTSTQTTLAANIDATRQGIAGINIDEETQNLIKYQNAYQAAARTMNVLDSLLNTIVNTLGVITP